MKVAPFVLIRNFFPLPLSYPTRRLTVFRANYVEACSNDDILNCSESNSIS